MTIGLALSGGGALGAAHIGVMQGLAERGVRVDAVAGTSAGALTGLLFAAGGMPAIQAFLDDLHTAGLINAGLVLRSSDRIFANIRAALAAHVPARFSDLPIPFFCVATDIMTGEMVVLREGNPVEAVLASCAVPGVFPMQRVDGRWLVDGGLTRNLPADLLRAHGADVLIGSSLYCLSPLTAAQQRGRISRLHVVARALEIIERDRSAAQMAHCDFCFTPPVETYKWYEFDQVAELRGVGYTYARRQMEGLEAVLPSYSSS
jgi:NTE family protein